MAIWLYRERRRLAASSPQRLESGDDDGASRSEKAAAKTRIMLQLRKPTDVPKVIVRSASLGVSRNPPYTDVKFELVTPVYGKPTSDPQANRTMVDPVAGEDEPLSAIPVPITTPLPLMPEGVGLRGPVSSFQLRDSELRGGSMSSADIAQILEMATIYSGPGTPQAQPPLPGSTERYLASGGSTNASSPVLLSPHSTETHRDPPQVPLPSSPLPSPSVGPSLRIGSMISGGRGLSGFSFFKVERASTSGSFLNM